MEKKKVSTWNDLKKTRESLYEIPDFGVIKLRGITESERATVKEASTETRFNKELKKDEERLNDEEFAFRLVITGWVEPEIPGETFEAKKEALKDLAFGILQNISGEISKLSGISREDIEQTKNVSGPT